MNELLEIVSYLVETQITELFMIMYDGSIVWNECQH